MALSGPFGTTRCFPHEDSVIRNQSRCSFSILMSLIKMAGYYSRSFYVCLSSSTPFRSTNTRKKKDLGQYPAVLNSCLVDNPYLFLKPNYHNKVSFFLTQKVCKPSSRPATPRQRISERLCMQQNSYLSFSIKTQLYIKSFRSSHCAL